MFVEFFFLDCNIVLEVIINVGWLLVSGNERTINVRIVSVLLISILSVKSLLRPLYSRLLLKLDLMPIIEC